MGRPGFVWAARAFVFLLGGFVAPAVVEAAYRPATHFGREARLEQPRVAAAPARRSGTRRFRRD
ncbi:MAG: hypothetical protein ACRD2X_00630, partial [Vicinamibacteraceae bacterium]